MEPAERAAIAIYWVGFKERQADRWPHNAMPRTPEAAWAKAGEVQQIYRRKQAAAAIEAIAP